MSVGRIEVRDDDARAVVVLVGELDLSHRAALRECFDQLREGVGSRQVVLDLTETTFLDSAVLGTIVAAYRDGLRFTARGATGAVRRTLEISGVGDLLVLD